MISISVNMVFTLWNKFDSNEFDSQNFSLSSNLSPHVKCMSLFCSLFMTAVGENATHKLFLFLRVQYANLNVCLSVRISVSLLFLYVTVQCFSTLLFSIYMHTKRASWDKGVKISIGQNVSLDCPLSLQRHVTIDIFRSVSTKIQHALSGTDVMTWAGWISRSEIKIVSLWERTHLCYRVDLM